MGKVFIEVANKCKIDWNHGSKLVKEISKLVDGMT